MFSGDNCYPNKKSIMFWIFINVNTCLHQDVCDQWWQLQYGSGPALSHKRYIYCQQLKTSQYSCIQGNIVETFPCWNHQNINNKEFIISKTVLTRNCSITDQNIASDSKCISVAIVSRRILVSQSSKRCIVIVYNNWILLYQHLPTHIILILPKYL